MSAGRRERLAFYRAAQHRYRPDRQEFARLVTTALEALPPEFRQRLENVAVVVEDWPPGSQPKAPEQAETLLGLYQGTPLPDRGSGYHLAVPDRITIYRGPILDLCHSREAVIREIEATVVHEVGHYFGLDEHELD